MKPTHTCYILQVLDSGKVIWEHMPSKSLPEAKAYLARERSFNITPNRTYRLVARTTTILPD